MLTGDIRNRVDRVWDGFWSGGISNPLEVIEQITYLLFLRRFDDLHTLDSTGVFQEKFKSAWESLLLIANGREPTRAKTGGSLDRTKLRQMDLHWHDLRHEGAWRLLAEGVDIRSIQLILGHSDVKQTQRYLNITDQELLKAMTGVWEKRR